MNKKRGLALIIFSVLLLALVYFVMPGSFAANESHQNKSSDIIQGSYAASKTQMSWMVSYYYYPKNFDELIQSGHLVYSGNVVGVQPAPYDNYPMTLAKVKVDKVLRGDPSLRGQTINVLFAGGDIKESDFKTNMGESPIAPSNKTITVEYSGTKLPEVGDQLAGIMNKATTGTNGIKDDFWMFVAPGSVFFKDDDNVYKRPKGFKSPDNNDQNINESITKLIEETKD
ncbi:hypothetical protein R4Y45_00565 [Holzapfeliella sp. He02]|uniref:Uncharacterized protein n=1 Tax=Holzapfeliella saturejae TaxID=3082953 RepID=A0ABU8SEF2_9LACO